MPAERGADLAIFGAKQRVAAARSSEKRGALPVDANVVLGRVMAHEIGHLLLPPNSHSRIGIMRPHMDLSQVGVDTFTDDQISALHSAITGKYGSH